MNNWKNIFALPAHSGLYCTGRVRKNSAVLKTAGKAGLHTACVNLKTCHDKQSLMETVSRQLAFPSYFGMNWDGLHDLLTDFSWKPAGGYMIIFTNFTAFKNRLPAEATILIDVLHSSAAYWKDRGTGFYVILSG